MPRVGFSTRLIQRSSEDFPALFGPIRQQTPLHELKMKAIESSKRSILYCKIKYIQFNAQRHNPLIAGKIADVLLPAQQIKKERRPKKRGNDTYRKLRRGDYGPGQRIRTDQQDSPR